MNRWKISTIVCGLALAASLGVNVVRSVSAEPQPHMRAALGALESALGELKTAEHDKGGWRAAATRATETAITETKRGIAFDNHH
jgi:hypothetical protein